MYSPNLNDKLFIVYHDISQRKQVMINKFTEKICDMDCGKLRSPWKNKTSEVCHCVDNRCIELNCESGFYLTSAIGPFSLNTF